MNWQMQAACHNVHQVSYLQQLYLIADVYGTCADRWDCMFCSFAQLVELEILYCTCSAHVRATSGSWVRQPWRTTAGIDSATSVADTPRWRFNVVNMPNITLTTISIIQYFLFSRQLNCSLCFIAVPYLPSMYAFTDSRDEKAIVVLCE